MIGKREGEGGSVLLVFQGKGFKSQGIKKDYCCDKKVKLCWGLCFNCFLYLFSVFEICPISASLTTRIKLTVSAIIYLKINLREKTGFPYLLKRKRKS